MLNRRIPLQAIGALALAIAAGGACAQSKPFPTKAVRLLVPYNAGGGTDTYARMVGQELSTMWKQPVLVENKPGAAGALALQAMISAPHDGHTMGVTSVSLAVNSLIIPSLPYKDSDVVPVVNLVSAPNVLIVAPDSKYRTAKDLIEDAKKNPGKLSYGTAGNGTTQHIVGEMMKLQEKLDMVAVPYKGNMPSMTDVMAGQIPMAFSSVPEILPFIKGGKLRALAIMGKQRSPLMPNIPTIAEAGYPNLDSTLWWGIVAPAGTPPEIIEQVNRDVNTVLKNPDIRKRIEETGGTVEGGSARDLAAQIASDRSRSASVIKAANIRNQ